MPETPRFTTGDRVVHRDTGDAGTVVKQSFWDADTYLVSFDRLTTPNGVLHQITVKLEVARIARA